MGWTDYRFPAWSPVAMTVWAATFTAGLLYLDGLWGNLSSLAHLAVALGYIWWDRRTQAAYPSSKSPMPREYLVGIVTIYAIPIALIPLVVLVNYYVAAWAAVLVASLGWGTTVYLYNQAYARASARVRERLS